MRASFVVDSRSNSGIVFTKPNGELWKGKVPGRFSGTVPSVLSALPPRHRNSSLKSSTSLLCSVHMQCVFMPQPSLRQVLLAIQSSRVRWHMHDGYHSLAVILIEPRGSVHVSCRLFSSLFFFFSFAQRSGLVSSTAVTTFLFSFFPAELIMHN